MSIESLKQALKEYIDADNFPIEINPRKRAAIAAIEQAETPATRPATREEKIVNPGVYEIVQRAEEVFKSAKKRQWVGLTDEEIEDVWASCEPDWDDKVNVLTLARAIEAKLREKNSL
jgi:hypothetical protein